MTERWLSLWPASQQEWWIDGWKMEVKRQRGEEESRNTDMAEGEVEIWWKDEKTVREIHLHNYRKTVCGLQLTHITHVAPVMWQSIQTDSVHLVLTENNSLSQLNWWILPGLYRVPPRVGLFPLQVTAFYFFHFILKHQWLQWWGLLTYTSKNKWLKV